MTVDSLARARAGTRMLSQYVLACPGCAKPSAAHVDRNDPAAPPSLVRFVCPHGCAVDESSVLAQLPSDANSLTA